jgi:hypothetical protein
MKRTACWRIKHGYARLAFAFATVGLIAFSSPQKQNDLMAAQSAKISYIERWGVNGTNGVLLHFDTDANKTYTLQATDRLGTNAVWTNLYSAPNLPFQNHYIVPDLRPGNHFYRLHITQ